MSLGFRLQELWVIEYQYEYILILYFVVVMSYVLSCGDVRMLSESLSITKNQYR